MKLVLFNDDRLGVLKDGSVHDVSDAVKDIPRVTAQDLVNGVIAGFARLRPALEEASNGSAGVPVTDVRLRPPLPRLRQRILIGSHFGILHEEHYLLCVGFGSICTQYHCECKRYENRQEQPRTFNDCFHLSFLPLLCKSEKQKSQRTLAKNRKEQLALNNSYSPSEGRFPDALFGPTSP